MIWKRSFLTTSSCCMWKNVLSMMKKALCTGVWNTFHRAMKTRHRSYRIVGVPLSCRHWHVKLATQAPRFLSTCPGTSRSEFNIGELFFQLQEFTFHKHIRITSTTVVWYSTPTSNLKSTTSSQIL
jgi:hypothetical protein